MVKNIMKKTILFLLLLTSCSERMVVIDKEFVAVDTIWALKLKTIDEKSRIRVITTFYW